MKPEPAASEITRILPGPDEPPPGEAEHIHEYGPRVAAWEARVEQPLALLAVVFLALFAWRMLDTGLSAHAVTTIRYTGLAIWIVFAIDYLIRLVLAKHRFRYWFTHLADFAMVVLPVLRPLQLLRILVVLKVLNRHTANSFRGRVGVYVGSTTLLLLTCASLAVYAAERGAPGSTIESFGEAAWWAIVTVSTVGYGAIIPVTAAGRTIGVGLMIGGVALLGIVTATLSTWLVDRVRATDEADEEATKADVIALRKEISALRSEIAGLTVSRAEGGVGSGSAIAGSNTRETSNLGSGAGIDSSPEDGRS